MEIKEETPVEFVLILPAPNEIKIIKTEKAFESTCLSSEESIVNREIDIISTNTTLQSTNCCELMVEVRKFNKRWRTAEPELYKTYNTCLNCQAIFTQLRHLSRHAEACGKYRYRKSANNLKFMENPFERKLVKRNFQCDYCLRMFKSKRLIKSHLKTHVNFNCQLCHQNFPQSRLISHRQSHSQDHLAERFQCDLCLGMFRSKQIIRKHISCVHPNGEYSCEFRCWLTFKKLSDLLLHKRWHIAKNCFRCPDCTYETKFYKTLLAHVRKHRIIKVKTEPIETLKNSIINQLSIEYPEVNFRKFELSFPKFDYSWINKVKVFQSFTICPTCLQILRSGTNLEKHIRFCGKLFQCDLCGKYISNIYEARKHINGHLKNSSFLYKTGGQVFPFIKFVKYCQLTLKCVTCEQDFMKDKSLFSHIKQKHLTRKPLQVLRCNRCSHKSTNKYAMQIHITTHNKDLFSCNVCGRKYRRMEKLKEHQISLQHDQFAKLNQKRFYCDKCSRSYGTAPKLRRHQIATHVEKTFQCDKCAKYYACLNQLTVHMSLHFSKSSCKLCGKTFNAIGMTQHMKYSHPSGSYSCANCHKKFQTIEPYMDHKKVHIGKSRYKCFSCEYVTRNKERLLNHVKSKHCSVPDWFYRCM